MKFNDILQTVDQTCYQITLVTQYWRIDGMRIGVDLYYDPFMDNELEIETIFSGITPAYMQCCLTEKGFRDYLLEYPDVWVPAYDREKGRFDGEV